jgi:hypothetical protein
MISAMMVLRGCWLNFLAVAAVKTSRLIIRNYAAGLSEGSETQKLC